jgi:hypothetical protein
VVMKKALSTCRERWRVTDRVTNWEGNYTS